MCPQREETPGIGATPATSTFHLFFFPEFIAQSAFESRGTFVFVDLQTVSLFGQGKMEETWFGVGHTGFTCFGHKLFKWSESRTHCLISAPKTRGFRPLTTNLLVLSRECGNEPRRAPLKGSHQLEGLYRSLHVSFPAFHGTRQVKNASRL